MCSKIVFLEIIPGKICLKISLNYNSNFCSLVEIKYPVHKNPTSCNNLFTLLPKKSFNENKLKVVKIKQLKGVIVEYDLYSKTFFYKCPENIYLFDSMLRVVCSIIFAKNNTLILHSAGILKSQRFCEIYAGATNSGKSTLAKKFSAKYVLSDELCPVSVEGKKVVSWRSLFYSEVTPEVNFKKKFLVDDIAFLLRRKDSLVPKKLSIKELDTKKAIKFLLKNVFWVVKNNNFSKDIFNTVVKVVNLLQK